MTNEERKLVERAMKRAARKGFNPYNSHEAMAREWHRVMAEKVRREDERAARLAQAI